MSQQLIDIGQLPDDHTGDPLRNAFNKINENFIELYTSSNTIQISNINASGTPSNITFLRGDGTWSPLTGIGTGTVTSVTGEGTVSGLTLTGSVTDAGSLTLGGTLAVQVTNITASGARNSSTFLRGDGTWSPLYVPVSNIIAAGNLTSSTYLRGDGLWSTLSIPIGNINASGSTNSSTFLRGDGQWAPVSISVLTGTLPVANGGTGLTSLVSNGAIYALSSSTLTCGTLPVTSGGTGLSAVTVNGAIYATSNSTLTSGTLPIGSGGTGATTASAARTALGLGTMATQNSSGISITAGSITNSPTSSTDIVNKAYVDLVASSLVTGVNYHQAVDYATTSNLGTFTYSNGTQGVDATITGPVNSILTIDGHIMSATDVALAVRILVKNETSTNQKYNGIYVLTQVSTSPQTSWILTRASDFDTPGSGINEIDQGDFVYVNSGATNSNTAWVQQTPLPIIVGTTAIVWVQFAGIISYTASTGLTLSNTNQFYITNTGVTSGNYGDSANIPSLTINSQGQIVSASEVPVSIPASGISSGVLGTARGGTGLGSYTSGGAVYASSITTLTSGTLPVTAGGTGLSTITGYVKGSGTSALVASATIPASDISGTLAIANGGTNSTATPTAGAVPYGTGTAFAFTAAGTANQILMSNGVSAPTWRSLSSVTRISSTTSTATLSVNSDLYDFYIITALATNLSITIDSGSPVNGQKLMFRIKDDGQIRTISWATLVNKGYRQVGVILPSGTGTLIPGNTTYVGCVYNAEDQRWDVIAVGQS